MTRVIVLQNSTDPIAIRAPRTRLQEHPVTTVCTQYVALSVHTWWATQEDIVTIESLCSWLLPAEIPNDRDDARVLCTPRSPEVVFVLLFWFFFFFFKIFSKMFYVYVWPHVCLYTTFVPGTHGGQKKGRV